VAVVLVFLLRRYSLSEIGAEMGRGRPVAMIAPCLVMLIVSLVCVGLGDWLVVRSVARRPPSLWEQLRARAAISLLMILGYLFSGGGLGVWLARKTGMRVPATLGLLLYLMASEVGALAAIAALALLVGGGELLDPELRDLVRWLAPVLAGAVVVSALLAPRILAGRVREPQFWRAATAVPARAFAGNLLCRMAHLANVIACTAWAARGFGLDIPVAAMWTYMPVIIFVSALPINVLGFGAVSVVWLVFESATVSGPAILAFQVLWTVLVLVAIVARGLPFVRAVGAEIAAGAATGSAKSDSELAAAPAIE